MPKKLTLTLDDKLRETATMLWWNGQRSNVLHSKSKRYKAIHSAITSIKQAFADDGYYKPHIEVTPSKELFVNEDGEILRTGEQWYARFSKLFDSTDHGYHGGYVEIAAVLAIADRASRLE